MARPIWNGTISFGLLNIPVQLFSGERSVDLHLRMLDSRTKTPIRYERVNSETGEEVPWKDIVKAFEFSKGSYVVIDEEEIRKAHPEATETVEIEAFVDEDSIDSRYFSKPYILVPGKKAEKGYVLLRDTLKKTQKIGIAKVVIRTRQYLAAVLPQDKGLLLNLMRFPQELIAADDFALPGESGSKYRITAKEEEMAESLVKSMVTKWNPNDYKDDFREKLHKIINERVNKQGGKKIKVTDDTRDIPGASTNVVDFMALLKKSLEKKAAPAARKASSKPAPRRRRAG